MEFCSQPKWLIWKADFYLNLFFVFIFSFPVNSVQVQRNFFTMKLKLFFPFLTSDVRSVSNSSRPKRQSRENVHVHEMWQYFFYFSFFFVIINIIDSSSAY